MARTDAPRLAILGAGPIGLEAGLYAALLKLPFTIYERGRVGEHLHHWGHVRLFSPFGMNATPLGVERVRAENPGLELPTPDAIITGREHVQTYLEPLAKSPLLRDHLRTESLVLMVGRKGMLKSDSPGDPKRGQQPFRLLVRHNNVERYEEADVVLDCTGTYGRPRWLGDGGIFALGEQAARPHIAAGLEDILGERRGHYADRTVLVVGAGYSAATTVCNLAELARTSPGTWVIWIARGARSTPLKRFQNDPLRERDLLAGRANQLATRTDGSVEFHPQTVLDAIEGGGQDRPFKVTARAPGKTLQWEVDRIIANVGYTTDVSIYRELQVHECYATLGPMALAAALQKHAGSDCLAIPAAGPVTLRTPEPNFFLLGAKSYGRNSAFLLKTGFEQVRDVFTLITGKSDLDLYRKR